ncbi:MAG TPA: D-Ala-D-Ala carboxypeptidase family metallohydrolase [Longimicrobium sp.]|nr:D-Ala-D-Ala carboxypeptidase family metallohydrolase [Longimicrobium sp.]
MSAAFEQFIRQNANLQFFSWRELLFPGDAHGNRRSAGFGLNGDPPSNLWGNVIPTIQILDALRAELGAPIRIISAYRTPAYNRAIGGALRSYHTTFQAIDFVAARGTPSVWAQELKEMRHAGLFKGGIGLYRGFVHVDTRGWNADW